MTVVETPPVKDAVVEEAASDLGATKRADRPAPRGPDLPDVRPPLAELIRPAAASVLVSVGAGFEIGGIFGSWAARLLAVSAALAGAAAAVGAQRSPRRDAILSVFPFAALVVAVASLIGAPGGPAMVVPLVQAALRSGSLLTPPVPFDPGWRVVVILTMALLGFAGAWIGTALAKPRLGLALCLPVIGLTAITQPANGKLLAGAVPLTLLVVALALLFGGDVRSARSLGRAFELKRAVRALAVGIPLLAAVIGFNSASFLFPKPVYNPVASAQKPRLVSAPTDAVLFEVRTTTKFTGPWRTGVLDIYKSNAWLLPPQDNSRLVNVSRDRPIPGVPTRPGTGDVTIVLHDLGDTPILPSLGGTESVQSPLSNLVVDTRTDILRVPTGRVPVGLIYTLHVPPYANNADLESTTPATGPAVAQQLRIPPPPSAVVALLARAPTTNAFDRMEYLEHALLNHVTAKGAGVPVDVTPADVQNMLVGARVGSPFQIVAAEAMIARWAGVPSRIGFGYDGVNKEQTGVISVRPHNAADWLEVDFRGYGWLPLVAHPKMAEQNLHQPKRHQNILANDQIAIQVFIPYRIVTPRQLYEIVRYYVALSAPLVLLVATMYLGWPILARARRRAKRRRWASREGFACQIAVEYAEMRDLATDLNVGDLVSTPLEYLFQVAQDDEHAELAWLTARALYGDLRETCGPQDVAAAEELSSSMRRRLRRAQPLHSRFFGMTSRASLRTPYEPAMPNVRLLRLPRPRPALRRWLRVLRARVPSLPKPRTRLST